MRFASVVDFMPKYIHLTPFRSAKSALLPPPPEQKNIQYFVYTWNEIVRLEVEP